MKFEITAPIVEIGAIESFGANGFQKRNLILLEQNSEYENPVCVEFSGDKIERPDSHQIGQMVTVSGFINCREWEGKYFTSLRGSFIKNAEQQEQPAQQFGTQQQTQVQIPIPQQQVVNAVSPQPTVAPQTFVQPATPQPQQIPPTMAPPVIPQQGDILF
jgi:hypothetical protein